MVGRWKRGVLTAAMLLAGGCMWSEEAANQAPPAPATAAAKQKGALGPGRVSTKSTEILILEPDGSVTEMALESAGGRDAFQVTEADLAALNVNLSLDLSGLPDQGPAGAARRRGPTAQERALAAFRARTQPALPKLSADMEIDPEVFAGSAVMALRKPGEKSQPTLIEVTAALQQGVDAELAFAYATCALAGWAERTGTPYARHVRTLQTRKDGKVRLGSVFTLTRSASAPMGLRVMETKATLAECKSRGIPAA